MAEKNQKGKGTMSNYLVQNYSVGSIIERSNYSRNKIRPYNTDSSLIERKIIKVKKRESLRWKIISLIFRK